MGNVEKKKLVVQDAILRFRDSSGIIITDYQGLTVEQVNKLRRELEKVGATYKVIKNTLSKKVLDELKVNGNLKGLLTGVTGLVFCKDYIGAVKVLTKFLKENESFKIKGGYIEEKAYTFDQIKELSKISSREELLTKLVVLLNQPVSKMVNQLAKPAKDIVLVLSAIKDKK